ncbi:MAG: MMPL family transporter [Planctomycetota bacterium]|nr:MMPL family transporter [Planctomycetota bacterium]
MKKSFYARYSLHIMAVCLFLLPFAVVGSLNAKKANKNDVKNWVPLEYPETQVYQQFRKKFQGEEFILVSWDGCNLNDKRLEFLAGKMVPAVEVKPRDGKPFKAYDLGKAQRMLADPDGEFQWQDAVYSDWIRVGEKEERMLVWPSADLAGTPGKWNEEAAVAEIVRQRPTLFKSVLTGARVVEQMQSAPLNLSREEIIDRLTGSLFGASKMEIAAAPVAGSTAAAGTATPSSVAATGSDEEYVEEEMTEEEEAALQADLASRQTCLVATLTEESLTNKALAVKKLRELAINECAIPAAVLHMGGPPVDNVAIDEAGQKSLNMLAGFAVIIGFAVSWLSLRDLRLVSIVIFAGIYSSILSLSIVWWAGSPVDAILFTMPSLVYVATTSGAIHLINYYRDVVKEKGVYDGAAGDALRHAALPLGLATGTTAVGLLTLCYTELVPIRIFGFYSSVGVLVSGALLIFLIPAALELWKPKLKAEEPSGVGPAADNAPHAHDPGLSHEGGFWWNAGQWVLQHNLALSAVCLLVMGAIGYGMVYSETSVQLLKLLSPRERLLADYAFLEKELGPLVPMEIVLHLPKTDGTEGLTFLDRLRMVEQIQRNVEEIKVEGIKVVGGTMSTVTFSRDLESPDSPAGGAGAAAATLFGAGRIGDSVLNKQLVRHRDEFMRGDYLREQINPKTGEAEELWRISARVSALNNIDYSKFIAELQAQVRPVLEAAKAETKIEIRDEYTGVVPLVYKAQNSLVDGLLLGFVTDFALIVIVMMIVCRDWSAGMVLLLPSAFPAVVVFGAMGWIHYFLTNYSTGSLFIDIGFVMAPCVALGVTVDDVVHFMLWFRQGIMEGMTRKEAVSLAYKGCARAMYQSWGVIGIGLAVFSLSPFMPTRNFGIMMIAMLTIALVGNLVMLPAVLAGPGGAIFAWGIRRKMARQKQANSSSKHGHDAKQKGKQLEPASTVPFGNKHEPVPQPHLQATHSSRHA